jgi:tetratricopeptide (TPR) repeat protein
VSALDRERLLREADAARRSGAAQLARERCAELLARFPDDFGALNLMAELAADERAIAEGRSWVARAIAADPSAAAAHFTLGRLHEAESDLAGAEASYRAALERDPAHARAQNNLGCVLQMQGRLAEALACYRRAIALDPRLPEANQNFASIAREPGLLERAAEGYRQQLDRNPRDADAWTNLANALRELGRNDEALEAFGRAIALEPSHAEARFSRAQVLLLRGEYAEGWREYEWRWRIEPHASRLARFAAPRWDGRRLGGALLLHAEQGLGDTLQFARYAPLAAERCAQLVLECQPELKTLLQSLRGPSRVLARGEPLPGFEAQLPLMSLPAVFGTTLETVPWSGPYVQPDPQRVAAWRSRLAQRGARLNVGLAWAGRPQQWDDRKRSMALAMLAPLAGTPGAKFYSLQKGEAAAEASSPPAGLDLVDLASAERDFSDAPLVGALDLVVTVDTSVAHLAGAMGVPVWVLVAYAPDWRYHLGRPDNPWYPSMRLFRQPRDGDWEGAIAALGRELRRAAGAA